MSRSAASVLRLPAVLAIVGGTAVATITLVNPGATRMYAWPWSIAYAVALLTPAAVLLLRAADRDHPIVLPAWPWLATVLISVALILISAACSPFRGPSLLWSTPLLAAIAVFLVVFDRLHCEPEKLAERRLRLTHLAGYFLAAVAAVSVGQWILSLPGRTITEVFYARNPFPLGHANYTAGLAVLMLPSLVGLAHQTKGFARAGWCLAALLALTMLFSSGSRGGLLGLAVLILGGLLTTRLAWGRILGIGTLALCLLLAFAMGNPRTRAMLDSVMHAESNLGDLQRLAMVKGGLMLGAERPWLGWGPGTTPLAFPNVRGALQGGAENVLQLHSLPIQLWAEFGAAGLVMLLAMLLLLAGGARRAPGLAVALAGYLAFALTDYQLDVPIFGFSLAFFAALLAPAEVVSSRVSRRLVSIAVIIAAGALVVGARRNPAPELNTRALAAATDPGRRAEAVRLLESSLVLNADQEIAHFNLGWLLLVEEPAKAERHFLEAARLVPDKGGVYFGMGLSRLNQGNADGAVQAFALECLNDPIFLTSPWWQNPQLAPLRDATLATAGALLDRVRRQPGPAVATPGGDADYLSALIRWFAGRIPAEEVLAHCNTDERRNYFTHPAAPDVLLQAPVLYYRRDRIGYPVLMRNLDLPVPTDLFDVQENSLAVGELRPLFPRKGWLSLRALSEMPAGSRDARPAF